MSSWLPGWRELLALVTQQGALIESLQAEVAALRRQAGRDVELVAAAEPGRPGGTAKAKAKAGRQGTLRTRTGSSQAARKATPERAWSGSRSRMRPGYWSRRRARAAVATWPARRDRLPPACRSPTCRRSRCG